MKYIYSNQTQKLNNDTLRSSTIKLIIICCCTFILGCESFVEVDPPQSELIGEVVFKEIGTANAALSAVYTQLKDNALLSGSALGLGYNIGLYGDELFYSGSVGNAGQLFFDNSLLASDSNSSSLFWNSSYSVVYKINAIIEGVDGSDTLIPTDKNQIKGEALFLRAIIHFYLVNLYGDIPYIKTTDYSVNKIVGKNSSQEIYNFIIADLQEAKDLLSEDYITGERIRINKGVVSAVLSRVFLYTQDWEKAESESTSIISNTTDYSLETDLEKVFLKENTGTIWQLKPSNDGDATKEGNVFILTSAPRNVSLANGVFEAFEPGDERKTNWVGTITEGSDTWYYSNKYKQRLEMGSSTEYSIVLRLAEQYLIRAEARAQQGDITRSQADLNTIRNRAGLGNTSASTTSELLDAIVSERRIELFLEFGHRWFDLKRLGMLDDALQPVKPGWDTSDALLPIPESELLVNPNLEPQNPGY